MFFSFGFDVVFGFPVDSKSLVENHRSLTKMKLGMTETSFLFLEVTVQALLMLPLTVALPQVPSREHRHPAPADSKGIRLHLKFQTKSEQTHRSLFSFSARVLELERHFKQSSRSTHSTYRSEI